MEIKAIKFLTDNSTTPALSIIYELEYISGKEIPISITDKMQTSDLKIVPNLTENHIVERTSFDLIESENGKYTAKNKSTKYYFQLTAPISKKGINHIEIFRELDVDKSVHLYFDLLVKYLTPAPKTHLSPTPPSLTLQLKRIQTDIRIQRQDWLKTCAPYFEIGNFILLELRTPDKISVNKLWSDLYTRLIHNISDMENCIRTGDWLSIMVYSRRFHENINFKDSKPTDQEFKDKLTNLFKEDGHTDVGIKNLLDGINCLFQLSS